MAITILIAMYYMILHDMKRYDIDLPDLKWVRFHLIFKYFLMQDSSFFPYFIFLSASSTFLGQT